MALNWKTLRAEHVQKACEMLLAGQHRPRPNAKGLYVDFQGHRLPAKQVMRVAYCLANDLSPDANLKFASGEGTLKRLQDLGFSVERCTIPSVTAGG